MSKTRKEETTYHRILTPEEGCTVFIDEIDRRIPGALFSGKINGGVWTHSGQLIVSEADIAALFGLMKFTVRAHKIIQEQEYILRLIDCSLQPGPEFFLNISRVVFWRPKELDKKEPRWEPTIAMTDPALDCGS